MYTKKTPWKEIYQNINSVLPWVVGLEIILTSLFLLSVILTNFILLSYFSNMQKKKGFKKATLNKKVTLLNKGEIKI